MRGSVARSLLQRSGWLPYALVVLAVVVLLREGAGVSLHDTAAFGIYVVGWLVMPGTLAWRAVDRRAGSRPLVEDLAIGALVGYVLEFPVYLAALAAGLPQAYLAWPVVCLLATLPFRRGRALWTRPVTRMPVWWSWSVSAGLLYLALWFGHFVWGPSAITDAALRRPYVDDAFHLALATELRHHFPPTVPYVAGETLHYHWLSHLHIAAGSWVSGVESIVLLRALAIPVLVLICGLGMAVIASRLTRAAWTGPAALAAVALGPALFSGWHASGEGFMAVRLLQSPSAGFVNAAILLGLVICVEILRRDLTGMRAYLLAMVVFVAMLGAKSVSLPTFMAGLVAAALVVSVVERRCHWPAVLLAVGSIAAFLVAKPLFFGSGSGGLEVDPLAFFGPRSTGAAVLSAVVLLVGYLSLGVGLIALATRRGWALADHVFLILLCGSGFGATLFFHQSGTSEWYFAYGVFLPLGLGAVLGLHRVVMALPVTASRRVWFVGGGFGAAVLATQVFVWLVDRWPHDAPTPSLSGRPASLGQVVSSFVLPMVAMLGAASVAVLVIVVVLSRRWRVAMRVLLPVTLVLVAAGLGSAGPVNALRSIVASPTPVPVIAGVDPTIGRGGITAARWLRQHSDPDTVVATNAHCAMPGDQPCVVRNFWMAAYAERRMLVEGWAYIHPEAPFAGAFWKRDVFADNEAVFRRPTLAALERLRSVHHVSWLFVDRRYPLRARALRALIQPVYRVGEYEIYRLD